VLADMLDAWLVGTGLDELDAYEDRIRAVTPKDMRALAVRYFDETKVVEGIVRGTRDVPAVT